MALDAETGRPICSRFFEGRATDRAVVRDLLRRVPFANVVLVVDRGLDGEENEELLARDGNNYVFPLDSDSAACREAVSDLDLKEKFVWSRGGETTVVDYAERVVGAGASSSSAT